MLALTGCFRRTNSYPFSTSRTRTKETICDWPMEQEHIYVHQLFYVTHPSFLEDNQIS